jgi:protein-L-isoaspartate(D-aspartate) O-methyltransferase
MVADWLFSPKASTTTSNVTEPDPAVLRQRLVAHLRRAGTLTDPAVERAFLTVPRELFVAPLAARNGLQAVYRDRAIVTKRDVLGRPSSSSSQPRIMAAMLQQLQVRPGQRVLEVGAGSGYNAALLATLVGPGGLVVSVELDDQVARSAQAALARGGYPVQVAAADGRHGWAAQAPFDRIIVTASTDDVPRAWFDQLVVGGRLVLPLRLSRRWFLPQAVVALQRTAVGLESVAMVPGAFMALRRPPGTRRVPGAAARSANRRPATLGAAAHGVVGGAARRLLQPLLLPPPVRPLYRSGQPPARPGPHRRAQSPALLARKELQATTTTVARWDQTGPHWAQMRAPSRTDLNNYVRILLTARATIEGWQGVAQTAGPARHIEVPTRVLRSRPSLPMASHSDQARTACSGCPGGHGRPALPRSAWSRPARPRSRRRSPCAPAPRVDAGRPGGVSRSTQRRNHPSAPTGTWLARRGA